jgi:hypothetical protein
MLYTQAGVTREASMQDQGGGGLAAVSIGVSEALVALVLVALVLFGIWKLAKLVWAAFSN